jgi:hypothetical protein
MAPYLAAWNDTQAQLELSILMDRGGAGPGGRVGTPAGPCGLDGPEPGPGNYTVITVGSACE